MIPNDKDRFECLKLAVSLYLPRQGVEVGQLADKIVQAAEKFYKFVSDGDPSERR